MIKAGDAVLFSKPTRDCVSDFGFKTHIGVIVKSEIGNNTILEGTSGSGICVVSGVPDECIGSIDDREEICNYIRDWYKRAIISAQASLKSATKDMKDREKAEKYESLKAQINRTAQNMVNSITDDDFENRLKELCKLKTQIFAIELDCVDEVRKKNGQIKYNISHLKSEMETQLSKIPSDAFVRGVLQHILHVEPSESKVKLCAVPPCTEQSASDKSRGKCEGSASIALTTGECEGNI